MLQNEDRFQSIPLGSFEVIWKRIEKIIENLEKYLQYDAEIEEILHLRKS